MKAVKREFQLLIKVFDLPTFGNQQQLGEDFTMRKITKLLSLAAFSIISLGLHSFPVHAEAIDTNGDGYPDFECAAPMSLPDGSVGCGSGGVSNSAPESNTLPDNGQEDHGWGWHVNQVAPEANGGAAQGAIEGLIVGGPEGAAAGALGGYVGGAVGSCLKCH
ncbi:MAG: hypothetical protein ACR9NN_22615 [Nostochopsis sp.]